MRLIGLAVMLVLATAVAAAAPKDEAEVGVTATPSAAASGELYAIEGTLKIPRTSRASAAKVILNGGLYVALVRGDGSFTVRDVPAGTYILEVSSVEYVFAPVRIDISLKEKKIKASSVVTRMGATGPVKSNERLSHPLSLRPIGSAEYFQKRVPYNVWAMFKNPMVIMMGVTLLMVVVFPKMMNNMSPEEKEEMQRMQSQMSLSNLMSGKFPSVDDGKAAAPGGGGKKQRRAITDAD